MSANKKASVMKQVECQPGCKRQVLLTMGIPRSTYYRWRQEEPKTKNRGSPWNRIMTNEERRILAVAREFSELSSRQLARLGHRS
ncbi:hypothetical protein ACFLXC_06420 [Chloroflexota bacterium]